MEQHPDDQPDHRQDVDDDGDDGDGVSHPVSLPTVKPRDDGTPTSGRQHESGAVAPASRTSQSLSSIACGNGNQSEDSPAKARRLRA
jgi:hypothetical protein